MHSLNSFEKENEILFIQREFEKITNHKFDKNYIKDYLIKVILKIKNENNIIVSGSQGSGKSSLSILIKKYLEKFHKKSVVIISIDDFYLSQKKRLQLARKIHPLFLTRGVPGTHDWKMLNQKIKQIRNKEFPVYLPIFDKVTDSRKKSYKRIAKGDVIIFEGWCVCASSIEKKYLENNINDLEKYKDSQSIWRNAYNNFLKNYQKIFLQFNYIIFFQFDRWEHVLNWKYKQELQLREKKKDLKLKNNLNEFIQFYEKISKWMHLKVPKYCNILIKLDANQKIKSIKSK
ncbi:MAG: hypothetical protein ACJ0RD_03520 [Alphaproteobacteria bacterium]